MYICLHLLLAPLLLISTSSCFVDACYSPDQLNEILLILFDTFVFLSDLHQELVLGPHPREGTDVSPACPELTRIDEVVQEFWGLQIAWCITGV